MFARLVDKQVLSPDDIRDAMDALGIYQRDFAEEIGVSPQGLSTVLKERVPLNAKFDMRVRKLLGLEISGRPPSAARSPTRMHLAPRGTDWGKPIPTSRYDWRS